jgi:cellulose synthase operon protein C
MTPSIVDKYEQILAADPRSRIFVELAKALVERGEHVRAEQVCERGLEHHPSSILGRVIWGRALLERGDAKGAMDQFEIAIGIDPGSPYAYNHVGEALVGKGLHREALPVLARAAELQPADARVRGWLEEARRRALATRAGGAPTEATPPDGDDEATVPFRPLRQPAQDGSPGPRAEGERRTGDPGGAEAGGATPAPAASAPSSVEAGAPVDPAVLTGADAAAREDEPLSGADPGPAPDATAGDEPLSAGVASAPDAAPAAPGTVAAPGAGPLGPAPEGVPRPPPLPRPTPQPGAAEMARSVLHLIPGAARDATGPAAPPPEPVAPGAAAEDPAEAERIAEQYARALREKIAAAPPPPPSFVDRHRRALAAGAVALAIGAAAGVYLFLDRQNAEVLAKSAASRGRAGLARDTLGSLREAHRLLAEARRRAGGDPEVAALAAQVAAVLAAEHGDEDARAVAEALARDDHAGDGAVAARWLLATSPAEREAAERDVLAARPSSAPLLQALAGRILASRGEREGGRGRLELAARANPPLLRALADLGDLALAEGDAEAALSLHGAALAGHATHPRAVVGAAEARLALGKDLEVARRDLAAVEADPASAPPADLVARHEIAYARVLAASGDPAASAARLAKASQAHGENAALAAALAEVLLAARAWDRAEAAAERATTLEPRETSHRVLLARARIGRGRLAEALAATEGHDGRAIRVQRAIARYRLGQHRQARAELERTARDGKMPAEAAVWYALVDVATGGLDRALPLLERLAAAPSPPPDAHLALGQAREAAGKLEAAEEAYRAAAVRAPSEPAPLVALGRLFVAGGRAADALAPLEAATKLDPSDVSARRALGEARLATGQPAAARADLDLVLLAAPRDVAALRLLSAAWLAEGETTEARRAASRALQSAPLDPEVLLAAARAALAAGDRPAAKSLATRALKRGAAGKLAAEAKQLVRDATPAAAPPRAAATARAR